MEQKKEHSHQKTNTKSQNLYLIFVGLSVLLAVILLVNVVMTYNLNSSIKNQQDAIEKLRPAKIETIELSDSRCTDCFDISLVTGALKETHVNITSEKKILSSSKEGKELIAKYSIEKLPALVVQGEISKVTVEIFDLKDDALVFAQPAAPYVNVSSNNIVGRVTLYHPKTLPAKMRRSFIHDKR